MRAWLQEWEKEQKNNLITIGNKVAELRKTAFAESGYGSREKMMQMQAMVNAYDNALELLEGK